MSRQNDLMTISVDDVVHTLRECQRDWKYSGRLGPMLAFASELTGISEDGLMELMDGEREIDEDFVLSEDTDFGCNLMAFISDWREDLGFAAEDVAQARENVCLGVIAMDVQGYLMEIDCSLDDIDMGKYTADERVMDLVHIVTKAYQDYLNGNYTESTVKKFVEAFGTEKAVVAEVLSDAQSRACETVSAADKVEDMGRN